MLRPCFRADEIAERRRAKSAAPRGVSEAAGDFGLRLHHPQILFGEVVGEGNGEIGEESEGRLFEGLEPDEQIVSRCFLRFFGLVEGSKVGRLLCRARPARTAAQYLSSNALIVSGASAAAP
jgi:hypothetical protein